MCMRIEEEEEVYAPANTVSGKSRTGLEILPFLHHHEDSHFSDHLGVHEVHCVSVQVLSKARSIPVAPSRG